MFLTRDACNIWVATDAWEFALHTTSASHDANVLRPLRQRPHERWTVTTTAFVQARLPRTARTAASKDTICATVARQTWSSSRNMTRVLEVSQPGLLTVILDNQLDSHYFPWNVYFQTIILCTYSMYNYKTPTIWAVHIVCNLQWRVSGKLFISEQTLCNILDVLETCVLLG